MTAQTLTRAANDWDRSGLPHWTYTSAELMELERDVLFRRHWQLAGFTCDVAEPGDWFTFDMMGERAIIIRGRDGVIRAFHNVCRHRGSRVVAGAQGTCKSSLVCPFHGWVYNIDGTLRGAAQPQTLPPLDPVTHGLVPLELEIWHQVIFIRWQHSDQPPVAELLRKYEAEAAPYFARPLKPSREGFWTGDTAVNWKSVRDVDNEGYHVAMAHPGLQDLYGQGYHDEPFEDGVSRSVGRFNPGPGRTWSVRHYKKLLPQAVHLPEHSRDRWTYIGLFPNAVISLQPDAIKFYQEWPLSPGLTRQRAAMYGYVDEDRLTRAARYLSSRIDRDTGAEDVQLTIWSCEAPQSSGYQGILLSDLEQGVRAHHDHMRALLPVIDRPQPPAPGTLAAANAADLAARTAGPAR